MSGVERLACLNCSLEILPGQRFYVASDDNEIYFDKRECYDTWQFRDVCNIENIEENELVYKPE